MRIAARIISIALVIGYPLAMWKGLAMASGRIVGGVVLVALAVALPLRFISRPKRDFELLGSGITLTVLVLLAVLFDDRRFLLAMPVLINATLLAGFGMSLRAGRTPLVERFARMTHKDLSVERIRHCRSVTRIWCLFFIGNGLASLWLALFASLSTWALYTGVIAYMLMGALFAGEYAVRRIRFG